MNLVGFIIRILHKMIVSALWHIVHTFLLPKPRTRKVFAVPSVFLADLLRLISLQL